MDFFSFLRATPRNRHQSGLAPKEVEKYLENFCIDMEDDPLSFWQTNSVQYPVLSKLAIKYLTIQSSLASVERLFSLAGMMDSAQTDAV
ncbi:hypothetical protein KP79_PYT25112 [Mizuhopecten yessoensis]|uniref:HAT C-terminal dimerisation domain-containing protein n=1 Tax=Mizuhopecten yessoensis TaxID=6573 RepID=A0A210PVC7_MIZYE|nr:hypothetical protein KP79_PYT25112 [Mizuhopecten yessoensis]